MEHHSATYVMVRSSRSSCCNWWLTFEIAWAVSTGQCTGASSISSRSISLSSLPLGTLLRSPLLKIDASTHLQSTSSTVWHSW